VDLRTLQRRFRSEIGISPRMLQRLVRFRRAFRMLSGPRPMSLARAAVLAGYFDQSHMTRDFRRFAGSAPARFFQAEPELAEAFLTGTSI
jgi:transcriptional regulator GlxA family with amidase domain